MQTLWRGRWYAWRYYDPQARAWMTKDPLGFASGNRNFDENSGIYLYPEPNGSIVIVDNGPAIQRKWTSAEVLDDRMMRARNPKITAPQGECGCGSH